MDDKEDTTHFGYREVKTDEKAGMVAEVFDSVATRYDLMNDLMSGGVHRVWKRFTIELSGVRRGNRVLDIAGGTGDLAARFGPLVGEDGEVVLADINASMLRVGRDRLIDRGMATNLHYVQADAQHLPFPEESFDCITIAFGLRNVTHLEHALAEAHRVLRPGGQFACLEFSRPWAWFRPFYDAYSFLVIPRLGAWIADQPDAYQYLVESIRRFPDQEAFAALLRRAGFSDVRYRNVSMGIACIHRATR